jgi:NAD(P)-dependent dehydrogenase (short-subunit alcohol dehydrogenase family)
MIMEKRKAIVTGAYGAIGKAIARGMAAKGYDVTLAGRNEEQLAKAVAEIKKQTGSDTMDYHVVDLSDKAEIAAFAHSWNGPLHILINNAATTPRQRLETDAGIEMQFATNVLGYLWMSDAFMPHMVKQQDARIVNVASYWAGDLDLSDLEFKKRKYNNDTAYRQTKQANRMLTVALAQELAPHGIAVLAAHPGDVNSRLSNNLGYGGMATPDEGAATPLFCAMDQSLLGITGKYFENMHETRCQFAHDKEAIARLLEICRSY